MLLTGEPLDATLVRLVDAHNAATPIPVVLLAGVLFAAPLISPMDDVVLLTVVRLDAKMVVRGVPCAGMLLDALLVPLVDVRDVVLVDIVMLVPDAVLTAVLLDALLTSPKGMAEQRHPPEGRTRARGRLTSSAALSTHGGGDAPWQRRA